MIFNFDSFDRQEYPCLMLCQPNDTPVGMLAGISKLECKIKFNDVSEISFEISKMLDGQINPLYDQLKTRKEILVKNIRVRREDKIGLTRDLGYFIITDVSEEGSDSNPTKTITASSCEWELNRIELHYVEGVYRMYKADNSEDKLLLNEIMKRIPRWTLAHVDDDVAELYRTFEFNKSTIYNFLMSDFADAYGVIVEYDILNRTISFYNKETYIEKNNQRTHVKISLRDVINDIKIGTNIDSLYTAMYVPSNGLLDISAVNPMGNNMIYNFTPFKTLEWMSQGLINALDSWEANLKTASLRSGIYAYHERLASDVTLGTGESVTTFPTTGQVTGDYYIATHNYNLLTNGSTTELIRATDCSIYQWDGAQYKAITYSNITNTSLLSLILAYENEKLTTINSELAELEDNLKDLEAQKGRIISSPATPQRDTELNTINSDIAKTQASITSENAVLANKTATINTIQTRFDTVTNSLNLEKVLTNDQLAELSAYIFEGSFEDDTVTVTDAMTYVEIQEQCQTLYDRAVLLLSKTSDPNQDFSIDTQGVIFNKDMSAFTKEINTGCVVGIVCPNDEVKEYVLLEIDISYDEQNVALTFGNRFKLSNPTDVFADLYAEASKNSNTVSYIKDIFDFNKANKELNASELFRKSSLDLTNQSIISSTNQEMVIDKAGIRGRKWNENSQKFEPEQIWLTNNTLAFSDDGFNSIKTAVGKIYFNYDYNGDGVTNEKDYVYGVNAEYIIGNMILGEHLTIGDSKNNVNISSDGITVLGKESNEKPTQKLTMNAKDGFGIHYCNDGIHWIQCAGITETGRAFVQSISNLQDSSWYAEMGVTGDGSQQQGLTLTSRTTPHYLTITENSGSVLFYDKNVQRMTFGINGTVLSDQYGKTRFIAGAGGTIIYVNDDTYIYADATSFRFVRGGATLAQW